MKAKTPAEKKVRVARLDHRQHVSSLDGVRGVAILMVFCHHLCPFAGGSAVAAVCSTLWLGVDLFFVLSGFLITGVLCDTVSDAGYFPVFYVRRALRLLPVYVLVVAMVLVANAALGGRLTVWSLPYFAYASNVIRDVGLPIGVVQQLDVSHFWSLAVEEQFYLLWPLAVLLARTRRRIFWMCVVGAGLSVALRFVATGEAHLVPGTPYFELPMRLDSLLLGGALAMLVRSPRGGAMLTPLKLHATLGAGLVGLVASFAASGHGSMFVLPTVRYGYLAASVTFVALVGLALQGGWVSRVGNLPLLRLFGRCSYGLYLIHLIPRHWYYAALGWAQSRCSSGVAYHAVSVGVFLFYLLLCFGVAMLSYATLERYFLRMKSCFLYRDERDDRVLAAAHAE